MRTALTLFFALLCSIAVAHTDGIYNRTANSVGDTQGIDSAVSSAAPPALACTYTPITTGTQNVAYTGATPAASGGVLAYTFSETGALPTGLTINSGTGVISGTPSVSGSFTNIQVKVTDSALTAANCGTPFTLTISTTWNTADKAASVTLSGGNLVATSSANNGDAVRAVASHSTGKFFYSAVFSGATNNLLYIGFCNGTYPISATNPSTTTNCVVMSTATGLVFVGGGTCAGIAIALGDVLDIAADLGGKLLWYRTNNGAWQGNGGASPNPATGTNGCNIAAVAAGPYFPTTAWFTGLSTSVTANFGATAYTNAAPAGFGNW